MLHKPLFSEILRPRQISDLALPRRDIDQLEEMVAAKAIMNLLFHGKNGTGKTSAARSISSSLSPRASIEFDGSLLNGVEFVHEHIKSYAMSGCLYAERKILFIDQADLGVKRAQYALLKTVEDSRTSRYIFAANDRSKLIPALRSRLVSICFDVPASDQAEVQMRLLERYRRVFEEKALPYDQDRVRDILRTHYPDLRAIANHLDVEFATPAYAALARDGVRQSANEH